ncbi:MAG: alkaline phosphatase D family protein, partial [Chloroflexota bacterium]
FVLWARSTAVGTLTAEVTGTAPDGNTVTGTYTVEVNDTTIPAKIVVGSDAGFMAGMAITYTISDAADSTLSGNFRLPEALDSTTARNLRFGTSGDWRGELRPYPAMANIPERDLDFFMMLGDSAYVDLSSLDLNRMARTLSEFRIKHNEVYSNRFGKNYWAAVRASTALYLTIDDHEVRNDFSGGADPNTQIRMSDADRAFEYTNQTFTYQYAMQSFSEYNPLRDDTYEGTDDPRMDGRPKLYRYVNFGSEAAIFVIDARSFRDQAVESIGNVFASAEIRRWNEDVWEAGRTMLGSAQVADLKRDLLDAQNKGIVWKFIMLPEPSQQMGWFNGEDRWEGFAPERTEVLQFIQENAIQNVVFISADIHSTFINNLTYQTEPQGDLVDTDVWEISTGPGAFYPPTGQAITEFSRQLGVMLPYEIEDYEAGDLVEKDRILERLFNRLVSTSQQLRQLGLKPELTDYELLVGGWTVGHTMGWTEFEIDRDTRALTVTTYGIPSYSADDMTANPELFANLVPDIMQQMVVQARF